MGTNVYFVSTNKDAVLKYFGDSYEIVDNPYLGYQIHVLKRSMGWLPLWQAHNYCRSVKDYQKAYNSGFFEIYDEYGEKYDWSKFWEEFAQFNGGRKGVRPRERIKQDPKSDFFDPDMPEYGPISHFDYARGKYADEYFMDDENFEFTERWFA